MTVSPLTADQEMEFAAWRALALERMPYFSRLLFSLRVLNAPGLGTWAVDNGHRMYIDFDAVMPRGVEWNVESVLHEASHLFADHAKMRTDLGIGDRDVQKLQVLNVANDLSINDDLTQAGCVTFRQDKMLPEFIGEPEGETPHHYFRVLMQKTRQAQRDKQQGGDRSAGQQDQQQQQQQDPQAADPNCPQHGKPQDAAPQPSPGNADQGGGNGGECPEAGGQNGSGPGGPGPGRGQDESDGNGGNGGQGSGQGHSHGPAGDACTCPPPDPFRGCGSGSGGQAWSGELSPSDDLDGMAPEAGEIEREAIRLATAAAIQDYVSKGRGTVPGGLVAIAEKVLAPSKTPWQQILASKIRRTVASKMGAHDTDPTRRNRRKHDFTVTGPRGRRRAFVPGYYTPSPRLEVIRDTSGSMSANDLAIVTREVEAIAKKIGIRGDDLVVTDVDAAVHQSQKFTGRDSIKKVAGRGGTNMCVGIAAAVNRKVKPTAIIVITDGFTPWPDEAPVVPVVAAIVPSGDGVEGDAMLANLPEFIRGVVVDPAE